MELRDGMELELAVSRLALGGRGVARLDGRVVFVDGGLPGARVRARVTRVRKGFAEAEVTETLAPSSRAVAPECPHFGVCGGCLGRTSTTGTTFLEREQVARRLPAGGASGVEVAPAVPRPVYGYRNKMEFAFAGSSIWASTSAGVRAGPRHRDLPVMARGRRMLWVLSDWCRDWGWRLRLPDRQGRVAPSRAARIGGHGQRAGPPDHRYGPAAGTGCGNSVRPSRSVSRSDLGGPFRTAGRPRPWPSGNGRVRTRAAGWRRSWVRYGGGLAECFFADQSEAACGALWDGGNCRGSVPGARPGIYCGCGA
jgi:predicted RNA-binding protein with TRAM domain